MYSRTGYIEPDRLYITGLLVVSAIIVSLVGFVLDGLALWATYQTDDQERTETRRVHSQASPAGARLRPARQHSRNRITLANKSYSEDEWNIIVRRLREQEWLFNVEIFRGIVPRLSRPAVWNTVKGDWLDQSYLMKQGRSWYVKPQIRTLLDPPAPQGRQDTWLLPGEIGESEEN